MWPWPLKRCGVSGGSGKQLPGLNTWVPWGEKWGVEILHGEGSDVLGRTMSGGDT